VRPLRSPLSLVLAENEERARPPGGGELELMMCMRSIYACAWLVAVSLARGIYSGIRIDLRRRQTAPPSPAPSLTHFDSPDRLFGVAQPLAYSP
jgi:hypothetical protein